MHQRCAAVGQHLTSAKRGTYLFTQLELCYGVMLGEESTKCQRCSTSARLDIEHNLNHNCTNRLRYIIRAEKGTTVTENKSLSSMSYLISR